MRKPIKSKLTKRNLPEGIIASDLKWPEWDSKDKLIQNETNNGALTFYEVESRKGETYWCIATLYIGGHRTKAPDFTSNRTYAVKMDGSVVTCGAGPHVKQTMTVYIRESRKNAMQKYIDLHREGLAAAGQIRDRIGSRRAQGQLHRAAGHRSWLWD